MKPDSGMTINAADAKGPLDKNQQLICAVTIVLTQIQMNVFRCIRILFQSLFLSAIVMV